MLEVLETLSPALEKMRSICGMLRLIAMVRAVCQAFDPVMEYILI